MERTNEKAMRVIELTENELDLIVGGGDDNVARAAAALNVVLVMGSHPYAWAAAAYGLLK